MAESSTAKIQHVNKASSDQLLRKFAELGEDASKKIEDPLKPRKRCRTNYDSTVNSESPSNNSTSLVERKSLLPTMSRRTSLLRQLGIGRSSQLSRAKEIKNRSLIGAIEKTWRKTVEGASKLFIEKHYNRHKRLINDVV